MKIKLTITERIFLVYVLILLLFAFSACKTKKVEKEHIDSLVKEVYHYTDSVREKTIFQYETIYDTIKKEYVTTIKTIVQERSENKALQGTKDIKLRKDTIKVNKEPIITNKWLNWLFIGGCVGCFFLGIWIVKK